MIGDDEVVFRCRTTFYGRSTFGRNKPAEASAKSEGSYLGCADGRLQKRAAILVAPKAPPEAASYLGCADGRLQKRQAILVAPTGAVRGGKLS